MVCPTRQFRHVEVLRSDRSLQSLSRSRRTDPGTVN